MKKTALITALILMTAFTGSFANDGGVNRAVNANFVKEFKSANNVRWQNQKDYAIASFNMAGQILSAYYTYDGHLVAVLHHIPVDHLPIFLIKEIKKNYSEYWVTELFEAVADGDSHYYITLENADETMKLKSVGSTYWTLEKTRKKNG
ncbi:MAG: hypothetical protein ACHQEM_06675 [Chitinophagales bacterium]